MENSHKKKVVVVLVVLSLILFAFMLLATTNTITNVSGVETEGVGVYWNSNCTNRVESIDWGTLTLWSVKNIVVYIRNEDKEPRYLIMSTMNWTPTKASDYITLRWNYAVQRIDPGNVLQIKLTLSVSRDIQGISNFSFNIHIAGNDRLPGDVNGDGKISASDMLLVLNNFGKSSEEFPQGDLDGDGKVYISDMVIVLINFGAGG